MARKHPSMREVAACVVLVATACVSALAGCSAPPSGDESQRPRAAGASSSSSSSGASSAPGATRNDPPFGPPPPPPLDRPLRVLVGGDVLPHRPSLIAPAALATALAPLTPLFAKADAVVANYEAATGDVDSKTFRLAYAAPPGWLDELPKAGVRAVTVANNHACDLGAAGLTATLEAAVKSGVLALGADVDDPWAPRTIVEQNGKRICAVAWTTLSNSDGACSKSRRLAFARLSRAGKRHIDRAMAKARAQCDATIAIFHGGEEYAPQTSLVMDQAARAAEAGADAVVIHHPHVASPVVIHSTKDGRKVPLFASVGNLVTNQGESWKPPMSAVLSDNRRLVCVNGWTRLGVLADLAFSFDGGRGEATRGEATRGKAARPRLDWGVHLVWIDNEHADDRSITMPKIQARLLDSTADKAVIDRLSEDRRGPVALFSDPCWLERSGSARAGARDERCSSASSSEPAPATPARSTAAIRAKRRSPSARKGRSR